MAKKKSEAFDVKLSQEALDNLAHQLATEIDDAIVARSEWVQTGGIIDTCNWFYEQGQSAKNTRPFPGAADLTSPIITEKVDALRARLMKAVFGVDPFCFVEGWGSDAGKAPTVEAFHNWQTKKTGLRTEIGKVVHLGLIEDCAILEVSEKTETKRNTQVFDAALEMVDGAPSFGPDGQPAIRRDPVSGDPVQAQPGDPSAKIEYTTTKTKRLGPEYTAISMKDFFFLPGHAQNAKQLRGYAKRIWLRVPELEEQAKDGIYDADAVAALNTSSDRESSSETSMSSTSVTNVQPQTGAAVEKEAWQVCLLADFDKDGREEPYVITISTIYRVILRLKLDKFAMKVGRPRCVPFVLYPKSNSNYGYSYTYHKLITLAEEHTALRNMKADRSALATNAPMTRLASAMWDPDTEPFGVGRTITVNNHDEIRQLVVADVPPSIVQQEVMLLQYSERVSGLADASSGVLSAEQRTLGENKMVAGGSAVRVDEVIGHLHEAISQVMALSHAFWLESLDADPKGLDAPQGVMQQLEYRGNALTDGKFTADQLRGEFQFTPYGTDESADPQRQLANFNNSLIALTNLANTIPMFRAIFQDPEAAKAILEQWARAYGIRDTQPYFQAYARAQQAQMMMPQGVTPGMGQPAGQPGQPPQLGPGGGPDIAALMAQLGQQGATGDGFGFGGDSGGY